MQNKGIVFMGMGFELVAMLLGAIYLGQAIDRHFSWPGYSSAVLIILFMCLWIFHLVTMLQKFMNSQKDEKNK